MTKGYVQNHVKGTIDQIRPLLDELMASAQAVEDLDGSAPNKEVRKAGDAFNIAVQKASDALFLTVADDSAKRTLRTTRGNDPHTTN